MRMGPETILMDRAVGTEVKRSVPAMEAEATEMTALDMEATRKRSALSV